jgi:molybdate transport system permease protein
MASTTIRTASRARSEGRRRPLLRGALLLASAPLLLLLLVPIAALVLRVDPLQLLANLRAPEVAQAITLSLVTTLCAATLTVIFGTPLAFLLARHRVRGQTALDTLLDLPMVLPPSVAGIALLIAFGRRGLVGQHLDAVGITLAFTTAAVVLAQTFVAAPYYVKAAAAGFASVDRDLEQAATLDGSRWDVFRLVTLPLAWPAVLGGLVMCWARALGEFGATIIFAGNFPGRTQTMPLAIYIGFELEFDVALTLALILLVVSFTVLFVVRWLLQQRAAPE